MPIYRVKISETRRWVAGVEAADPEEAERLALANRLGRSSDEEPYAVGMWEEWLEPPTIEVESVIDQGKPS